MRMVSVGDELSIVNIWPCTYMSIEGRCLAAPMAFLSVFGSLRHSKGDGKLT